MTTDLSNPRRRVLLALGAALAAGARPVRAQDEGAEPPRLALLIGNRNYPDGEDLPPIHKNVRDLKAALEKRGFACTEALDLDQAASRALVERFSAQVRQSPADATVLFYFSGHGAQVDAENLLVGAGQSPKARPETLVKGSLQLTGDVVSTLPRRPQGLTIAIIDACRTSLKSALDGDGLNQVEAPPGTLIAFATGAGKPAIAPAVENVSTFYTASLVKLLNSASDEITFSDLFRLVKTDVQNTMLNHPVPLLRQFAQFPFIAENVQVRRRLAPRVAAAATPPPPRFKDSDERADWDKLEAALWPGDVLRLAEDYLKRHPDSRLAGSAQVARDGASEASQILRRNDVRLYRRSFQVGGSSGGGYGYGTPQPQPDEEAVRSEIWKAGRGDKDAAARLGRRWRDTDRYEGWMQFAAALGNGIAAYDLALYYRRNGQPQPAAQFEARARELGYTPPPSLDNTRK